MCTHNICFYGELEKIVLELSSSTFPEQVHCWWLKFRHTIFIICSLLCNYRSKTVLQIYMFLYNKWDDSRAE